MRKLYLVVFMILFLAVGDNYGLPSLKKDTIPAIHSTTTTINFSGYNWSVRTKKGNPGGNYWSDSPTSVWVDDEGILHLTIQKISGKWYCSEVSLDESLGYGEYRFYVSSKIDNFNKNVVLGMFTYLNDNNEIDIEFTKFGNSNRENVGWYTTQPYTVDGNNHNFYIKQTQNLSTHRFVWSPDKISYKSWEGHHVFSADSTLINEWDYTGNNIPEPSTEKLHLNVWLFNGDAPTDLKSVEVLIRAVKVYKQPVVEDLMIGIPEDTPLSTILGTLNTPGYDPEELVFTIVSGNDNNMYTIAEDGTIRLTKAPDYETSKTHQLTIKTFAGDLFTTSTISISVSNINDNTPEAEPLEIIIPENTSPGTLIGTIQGFDADGDAVNYKLISQNGVNTFYILSDGSIILNSALDYESNQTNTLTVEISDGTFVSTSTVTITISNTNDNFPQTENLTISVPEDTAVFSELGTVAGFDIDGDQLFYSIQSGNFNGTYSINSDGQLFLEKPLDYETDKGDILIIEVSDGIHSVLSIVTITVMNRVETGVTKKFTSSEIKLYPNPVTDWLTVSFGEDIFKQIEIIGLNGKVFASQTVLNSAELFKMNVSDLSSGIYFARMVGNSKNTIIKFSKK